MNRALLIILLFLVASVTACAPETSTFQSSSYRPAVTRVSVPPTAVTTPVPVSTPEDVPDAVQSLQRALATSDAPQLSSLLLDSVWVAQEGNEAAGDSLTRDAGIAWLKAHWSRPVISSSGYVRDSGLLTITTTGWALRAPLEQGVLVLNLHRYDDKGNMDDAQGQWKIDTILYQ